jgi:uncharacterized repeat protein (TIGR01451 family)
MKILMNLMILMMAMSTHALAQQQGHLDVTTSVQKEEVTVDESGEPASKLVEANTVVPGDRVIYTITFRNTSEEAAENVVITNPISESLTYVAGSAFGPGTIIEFSVDGGQTYAPADQLTITEDGETRSAHPGDFTHIRWVMQNELAAGAQGTARFAAVLD